MAVMVSVTAINPTGTRVLGVGTTEADLGGGVVVFDPARPPWLQDVVAGMMHGTSTMRPT